MTNGDEFGGNQSGEQPSGGDNPPSHDPHEGVEGFQAPTRPEDHSHPLADNNFDVGAFFEILKTTAMRLKDSPVLIAVIGLAAISLAWGLLAGTAQMFTAFIAGDAGAGAVGMLFWFLGVLLYPVMLGVTVLQATLYRPASQLMFDGSIEIASPIDLIKANLGLALPLALTMFLLFMVTGIGMLMCILPGIVAAVLFCQAPYLVAVRGVGVIDAFKKSMERTMAHWHIVAMVIGVNLMVGIAMSAITGCGSFITGFMGPLAYLAQPILSWVGTTTIVIVGFIVTIAGFGTIDELDGIDIMVQD